MKGFKTKRKLCNSLKKMLKTKVLSEITIQSITEDCGLNRQTFYYHFDDIFDQVEWMLNHEVIEGFSNHKGQLLWEEGIVIVIDYIESNIDVYRNLLNSGFHNIMFKYSYKSIYKILLDTLIDLDKESVIPLWEKEELSKYYVIAFGSYINTWALGQISLSREEIVAFLRLQVKDKIEGMKQRYDKDFL